jgi:hypothetical protein
MTLSTWPWAETRGRSASSGRKGEGACILGEGWGMETGDGPRNKLYKEKEPSPDKNPDPTPLYTYTP